MLGVKELVIIFLIIFLLFGAKQLPKIARALGKAKKEFENPSGDEENEDKPACESDAGEEEKTGGDIL